MKATLQIPDEMYRRVKAKSALNGMTVRAVTIALYSNWLQGGELPFGAQAAADSAAEPAELPFFGCGRKFVRKNAEGAQDMAAIRGAISAGRRRAYAKVAKTRGFV